MNKYLSKITTVVIAGITAFSSPLSIVCEAPASADDQSQHVLKGEIKDHEDISVELKNDHFEDNETIEIKELDQDGFSHAYEVLDGNYEIVDGYSITIFDKDHKETEPEDKTSVRLNLPDDEVEKIKDTELYHIHKDEKEEKDTAEKLDYKVETEDQEDGSKQQYVSFDTDSFSSFVFVKQKPEETADTEQNAANAKPAVTDEEGKEETGETPATNDESSDNSYVINALTTELFYGAEKQDDETYVWNVNPSTDAYKKGHRFTFRINYAISGGNDGIPANELIFTVPKSILKDRDNAVADTTEWSIPSKAEVTNATKKDGTIDENEIDKSTLFCWEESGDNYVVKNFRPIEKDNMNGYLELAYMTAKSSFDYKDMDSMNPFTCHMQVGNLEKDATPINTAINTSAEITNTEITAPTQRIDNWDSNWGTDAKPENADNYYYALWSICSTVSATQPYNFTITPTLESNIEGAQVIGYRFSGQNTFQKENSVSNQRNRDRRWDTVLVAIPKENGDKENSWVTTLKVTNTVTPADGKDNQSDFTASRQWKWNKPEFKEPGGQFNTYKRGDGGYRTYPNNIWTMTTHHADSGSFHAGQHTRYDLEQFNGVGGIKPTLTTYNGFDYASWMIGYPGSATATDPSDPQTYWNNKVNYEFTDENVFLINNADALKSNNGSSERTIANNAVSAEVNGKKSAIKLGGDDFRIDSIDFSTRIYDADFDSNTQEFKTKNVNYTDDDVLEFYGKFGDNNNDWTEFATVNLKTHSVTSKDTKYVPDNGIAFYGDGNSTGSTGTITFNDNVNCTAYKVTTSNAHYYTEIYTVPDYELLNSKNVEDLLKDQTSFILLNNNYGKVTDSTGKQIHQSAHSDTDYAIKSQRNSSFKKSVVSTSNNTKKRYYTITWQLDEKETVKAGDNEQEKLLPQNGGVFYDLLPKGSTLDQKSVQVMDNYRVLPENSYEVYGISNYKNSGRTMLVVDIKTEGARYSVTFDTHHSWNSIKDYGASAYNPSAYETGNSSITKGQPDNGGSLTDKNLMSGLTKTTGHGTDSEGTNKFLFAENTWDITALTTASNGLTKKVKPARDNNYGTESQVAINEEYSYELRYMNAYTSQADNLVLFDSLENYESDGKKSDWHGTLKSIDVSQIKEKGADPVVYISTTPDLVIRQHQDVTDATVWTKVDDLSAPNALSGAKAVAIDLSKNSDGNDFVLGKGESVRAVLYMESPAQAPETEDQSYPYAYNNVYALAHVYDVDKQESETKPTLIEQHNTKLSLVVAADLPVYKFNNVTQTPVSGVVFRVYGTSAYGTNVDVKKTSGPDGNLTFEKLEMGNYILQEYDSTHDYFMDPTEHQVQITDDGKVLVDGSDVSTMDGGHYSIGNNPRVHANVYMTKADEQNPEIRPFGAEYRLKGTSDYGNDVLMFATSGENGEMLFDNVEKGTYELTEMKAPSGYVKSDTVYEITIDANGAVSVSRKGQDSGATTSSVTGHYDFGYTGSVQTFTAPATGSYQLQVWGAQGGNAGTGNFAYGGKGGYSIGIANLERGQKIYISVGGKGDDSHGTLESSNGGWNGGGNAKTETVIYNEMAAGGGCTSIQSELIGDGQLSNYESVKDTQVLLVAGGGGGAGKGVVDVSHLSTRTIHPGGAGGGEAGLDGTLAGTGPNIGGYGTGGTQTAGGKYHKNAWEDGNQGTIGSFGKGGNGQNGFGSKPSGLGGGGGWYGGGASYGASGSAGGGSGHIGSMLSDAQTIAGNQEFTSPGGGTETGHSGSGFARITPMFLDSNVIYDEPLHSIAFVKKSTYDKETLGGAEFSLTGTSDRGTAVNMSAASDSITGEVSFSGLEAGTYALKETKAPEGFEADQNTYPVKIDTTGAFTIEGLTSDNNGYVFYDRKLADEAVTVTKVWDDGEDHTDPTALDMTIQTNVPDAAQYSDLVWITNDDRLVLHVGKDVNITNITFKGDTSNEQMQIDNSKLVDASSTESVVKDDKTAKYFLMDSIVDGQDNHFTNIFNNFTPGENLTVTAEFNVDDKSGTRTMHCNSLFANGTTVNTALVGNGRHLQNINKFVSNVRPDITKVRLTSNIDWKGFTEIYGDWPVAKGNAKKSNEINIYSLNTSDTAETPKEVTVDDVLKDMKNETVNKLPAAGNETNDSGTNYTYTTKGKEWTQLSSNHWVIDDGDNPAIELTSSKNSEGNTVWTYTFAVEDNNRDYYVYEKMNNQLTEEGYTSSGSDGRSALDDDPGIVDKSTDSYTITNSKERTVNKGSLIISKSVSGNMPDPDKKFSFVITLSNQDGTEDTAITDALTGTKIFGSVPFTNGTAHITLGKDESVTIPDLPEGIHYSVTEDNADGYTPTSTGEDGTVSADTTSHASFVNTVVPVPEREKVSVKLQKKVDGVEPDGAVYTFHASFANLAANTRYSYGNDTFTSDKEGNAVVDVNLKKDGNVEFKDIPVGATYQFTEDGGIYTSSYEVNDANNIGSIAQAKGSSVNQNEQLSTKAETADKGEAVTVTFTNKYEVAQTLTLRKNVKDWKNGNAVTSDADKKFDFTVLFSNIPEDADITSTVGRVIPDENGTASKEFSVEGDGRPITFSGIPQGVKYQIIEGTKYRSNDENQSEQLNVSSDYVPSYEITTKDIYEKDKNGTHVTQSETFDSTNNKTAYTTDVETVDTNECDTVTFTNQRIHDLSVKEQVEGNLGDKSHYFKFTADLKGLTPNKKYQISGLSAEISGSTGTNPTEVIADNDGKASIDFWMKHSEKAIFNDLPAGTRYTITQEDVKTLGYTQRYTDNHEVPDGMDSDQEVTVTDELSGTIPTGINEKGNPWIMIIGLIGIAGFVIYRKKKYSLKS